MPTALPGCTAEKTVTGNAFGSYYAIEYSGDAEPSEISDFLARLDEDFSAEGTGDIGRINRTAAGETVTVAEHTFRALTLAFEISAATGGAFDPAAFPLTVLWRFSPSLYTGTGTSIPSEDEIAAALEISGTEHFMLDAENMTVTKLTEGAMLDLGAIGKGFAADEVWDMTRGGVVDVGATFRLGKSVKMYIQNPRGSDYVAEATISDIAVSTSGDYQRFYTVNGKRIHHIIARDGYPSGFFSDTPVISVTVAGASAAVCDALSTAFMVTGYTPEAVSIAAEYGVSALMFTEAGYYEIGDPPFEVVFGEKLN